MFLGTCAASAEELDTDLLSSLKIEANHNVNRLKSLKEEKKNNKVYEEQREKGLGQYLEEQENWEQLREKGLSEYRKQKKGLSPAEDGPEFNVYVRERAQQREKAEKNREVQVRTRNQMLNQNSQTISKLEEEELGLTENRPRFELRFRGKNKWVKGGASGGRASSPGSYSGGGDSDFPPPPPPIDYTPAPPPADAYEDIPPPPPPPPGYDYGAAVPYDAGYGDIPPPPPPPPAVDYDF